jgi:hypothetical protein
VAPLFGNLTAVLPLPQEDQNGAAATPNQRPTQGQLRAQQQQLIAAALMRKAEWEEMEIPQNWLPVPLIKVGLQQAVPITAFLQQAVVDDVPVMFFCWSCLCASYGFVQQAAAEGVLVIAARSSAHTQTQPHALSHVTPLHVEGVCTSDTIELTGEVTMPHPHSK